MRFDVLTLFPEMFNALGESIIGRAVKENKISINVINIRDFSKDKHKRVDDYPYGGGKGMVMQPEPIYDAYSSIEKSENTRVIYMTPQGKPLTQDMVKEYSKSEQLIILCGHYEGVDERVIEEIVTDEVSIGDYVLTGGELPAMVFIDSVSRMINGVLAEGSADDESFSEGLLEYPQYTRPAEFRGKPVPEVLLSGHHENIANWRKQKSIERTKQKRPDLLNNLD